MFPLARFCKQMVTYQPFAGVNDRDDPSYGPAQQVPARYVEVDREHFSKDEDVHQVRSKVWLLFQPVLRSLIDGREVIEETAIVPVNGSSAGWTAVLR